MTEDSIKETVAELQKFSPGKPLLNYITHARFPNFKGIERDATINFSFPFTALVGANGIGKSSILHALYGMPDGESTARFWFSTALDPIKHIVKDPPRYIYGHWNKSYNGTVETRKARVHSKIRGYEYWEPTKATKGDKMLPIPTQPYIRKDKDRWNAVERTVIYLNMKFTIGAFDRAFHFGTSSDQLSTKHAEMLAGAKKLKSVIDRQASSWLIGGGRERVFENRPLSPEELKHASQILGRKYNSAQFIRHSLYADQKSEDASVIFDRGFKYSEAFAGSGEVAVVSLVVSILKAPKYSLVLLDEPETSLHPGAQRELLLFILNQIKKNHLQVVISTHSIEFLNDLPHTAIKVFEDNGSGKSRILNECSPYVAFNRLGKPTPHVKRVYVEDLLAKAIVERAIEAFDAGEQNALEIVVAPGGAQGILANQIPTHITADTDCYVLLDGDQKLVESFTDPDTILPNRYPDLEGIVKTQIGLRPNFALNGGNDATGNAADKVQRYLNYLRWIRCRLDFLPQLCPEAIILDAKERQGLSTSEEFKEALRQKTGANQTPEGALGVARYLLRQLPDDHPDLIFIRSTMRRWLESVH